MASKNLKENMKWRHRHDEDLKKIDALSEALARHKLMLKTQATTLSTLQREAADEMNQRILLQQKNMELQETIQQQAAKIRWLLEVLLEFYRKVVVRNQEVKNENKGDKWVETMGLGGEGEHSKEGGVESPLGDLQGIG